MNNFNKQLEIGLAKNLPYKETLISKVNDL